MDSWMDTIISRPSIIHNAFSVITKHFNCSVNRTGKLAAEEEVVGWSYHRAQQHVYVASSPGCYGFLNVVLMKSQENSLSSVCIQTCTSIIS